ncbi:MAG: acyl-CoA dehydrogenase family protein [Alphaproteobacteria bacterium]
MADRAFLTWPFFEERHRALAEEVDAWAEASLGAIDHSDTDAACRALVSALGVAGFLRHAAIDPADSEPLDVRSLCLLRETLARHDGLVDFAFAMQGLGTGAISLFGSDEQKADWLPLVRAGQAIAAFALTEPASGSDVANISMTAVPDGNHYVLNGEKTWISNGGIADVYTLFARTGEAPGARGLSAFVVPADVPGFEIVERLQTIAPHPLARLRFSDCRVPATAMIGAAGAGFKISMSVLDVFRSTVAAAALGFARRALDEALSRIKRRQVQGALLAELQMVQGHIADMALDVDAAALLVYRAAWTKDSGAGRVTREAAMAKLFATERAQQVIDKAVQLHGGDGVRSGETVERLYREIRALRIYEGASDVQRVVIARQTFSAFAASRESSDVWTVCPCGYICARQPFAWPACG